jgi:hypothetical protein
VFHVDSGSTFLLSLHCSWILSRLKIDHFKKGVRQYVYFHTQTIVSCVMCVEIGIGIELTAALLGVMLWLATAYVSCVDVS